MVNAPKNDAYVPLPLPMPVGDLVAWIENQRTRSLDASAGPSRLIELEQFADIAANRVSTMILNNNHYANVRQMAMNRLRQLFNLEFKLRCDVCGTAHYQDEITAPER